MARVDSAPPGSRYADQRHYVVPASLADLLGPRRGTVTLDRSLDWSGDGTYDLDDAGDLQVMYQTVLNQAATAGDLCRWLDADLSAPAVADTLASCAIAVAVAGAFPGAGRTTTDAGRLNVEPGLLKLAEMGLRVAGRYGFALAGGYAVQAHGILDRPSEDIDLFTAWERRSDFTVAVEVVVDAYRAHGYAVAVTQQFDTFARLAVTDPALADHLYKVELAANWRALPPVMMDVGPVLHLDDVVAGKMSALFTRGGTAGLPRRRCRHSVRPIHA
jgi:hypothetical protein